MMALASDRAQQGSSAFNAPIGPEARLVADATAALAQLSGETVDDRQANQRAIEADDNIEHRIIYRARALPSAAAVQSAVSDVRHSMSLMMAVGVFLACIGGAATARAALAANNGIVNIYWAIAGLLGIQTLMLIAWFVLLCISRRAKQNGGVLAAGSLGGLLMRFARWSAMKAHRTAVHAAAASALLRMQVRSSAGRWWLSSLSHSLWLSFNIGALAMLIVLLSAREYTFVWETTILSPRQYVPLTEVLAAGPRVLGFVTPTRAQIEASSTPQDDAATRQAWSSFLLGAVVLYGFAPRLLLLGLSMGLRRREVKRYRLPLDRPDFIALQAKLMPTAERLGVIVGEGDPISRWAPEIDGAPQDHRPEGPPAILGFEIDSARQGSNWPPPVHAVHWEDMGFVDHRDDQRRVIAQVQSAASVPRVVVMICNLTTTPDRGVGAFVANMQKASGQRLRIVLTGGHALRQRADVAGVQRRLEDWRALAGQAGIAQECVVEVDLEHFTQTSAAKLAALIEASGQSHSQAYARRIDQALAIVAERSAMSEIDPAKLHRDILSLYRDTSGMIRGLSTFRIAVEDLKPSNLQETMKSAAGRFVELLPARMRLNPRWIAAGATAGALGCVAAASLIAPAAIAALPMWAALGASITAVIQPILSRANVQPPAAPDEQRAQVVRSAAMLSVVLEMQGFDEATITRVLDRTFDVQSDAPLQNANQIRDWLNQLRHRFDLALTEDQARSRGVTGT